MTLRFIKWLTAAAVIGLASCEKTPPADTPGIHVIQRYQVTARVIATKRYNAADDYWAPIDAVLAWGPLIHPSSTKNITFVQEGRWYHWFAPPNTNYTTIAQHTANTHLVADSPETRELILSLEEGNTYFLDGALVRITLPNGAVMTSSTSRTDRGSGACEVFLVKKATLVK